MSTLQETWFKLRQRFDGLPSNDRRALLIMGAVIALSVLYFSLSWTRTYQQSAITRYEDVSEDNRWIMLNLPQIRNLANAATKPAASGSADASLINRATTSAKPFGIVFKRFQPEDETGLRLWIEDAEFDQLMRWLAALEQQGILLDQLDIDKQAKQVGVVDARVLLSIKP
ncbi:MAG TPA: type II secretion system protein GspM [Pseudomonadales bacterium]|nr:type II secretion system protein GspM [Pseudomonadales bacterium]